MERWERERILGEWGVREGTAGSERERDRLAAELEGSPLKGRPLRRRLRNFRPDAASYIGAMLGPRPYMARLREIHDRTAAHERRLAAEWARLAAECRGDAELFDRRWRETAQRWNFVEVNDLIELHNRWFPLESRLPMDPRTGDFVLLDGRPYRRRPLGADWVLERFPPVLARAAEADVIRAALADFTSRSGPRPRMGTFEHGTLADRVDDLLREGLRRG